jgi:A/G-specific adenine glycosylase
LAYRQDPARSAGQRLLWAFAGELLPRKHVGDFNQALMELGSRVCTARAPGCSRCPVASLCCARQRGLQEVVPAARKKAKYEDVREAAVVVRRRGKVLLRRCGPDQRWAGLWDFPRFTIQARDGGALGKELAQRVRELTGVTIRPGRRLATIKHGVTRFRITLWCYEAEFVAGRARRAGREMKWAAPSQLEEFPLSVTGRKISRLVANQPGFAAAEAL